MDEFLRKAPKTLVAISAIVLGYFVIVALNPPRTVCDEQVDVLLQSHKSFLSVESKKVTRTAADEMFEICKQDNGPGGCFEYFLNLRTVVDGLERVPRNCAGTVGAHPVIKKLVLQSLKLFAQIGWGDASAGVYVSRKNAWLDAADFRLYCRLKTLATRFYGDDEFALFREGVMNSLPGAEAMSRDQRWARSIFSSSCES